MKMKVLKNSGKLKLLGFSIFLLLCLTLVFLGCKPEPEPAPDSKPANATVPDVTQNPTVTGVTITPATADVFKGGEKQFTAEVIGANSPAQTVSWTVEGGGAGTSINTSGLLTVAANETATSLTVKATSTVDTAKYNTVTVTVNNLSATVTNITIEPATADVFKGGEQQFTATVTGTGNPAQTVSWTVEGGGAGTSIDTSGLLTVAVNETATSLTVKATSTVDIAKSGTASVNVLSPTVTDVTITPATADVSKGGTQQFTADVTGTGNPAQTVTWTVEDGGAGTSIDTNGLLTVAANETAISLTVKATSTVDTAKSGTALVTVLSPTVTDVTVSPANLTVYKGDTQQFTAAVNGTNNPPQTVTWSIVESVVSGTSIDTSGLLTVAASETATSLTVKAASTFDITKFGTTTVSVAVRPSTVTSVTITPANTTVEKGSTKQFTAAVNGTGNPSQTVTWTVEGGGTGTGISINGKLTVAAGETASSLTVKATSTFDITKYGTATVTLLTVNPFTAEQCSEGVKLTINASKFPVMPTGTLRLKLQDDSGGYCWISNYDYSRNKVEIIYPFVQTGKTYTFILAERQTGTTLGQATVTANAGLGEYNFSNASSLSLNYNSGTKTMSFNSAPIVPSFSHSKITGKSWEWEFFKGNNLNDGVYKGYINSDNTSMVFDNTFDPVLGGRLSESNVFVDVYYCIIYDGRYFWKSAATSPSFTFPSFPQVGEVDLNIYTAFEANNRLYFGSRQGEVSQGENLYIDIGYYGYSSNNDSISIAFFINGTLVIQDTFDGENYSANLSTTGLAPGMNYGLVVVTINGVPFSKEFTFRVRN